MNKKILLALVVFSVVTSLVLLKWHAAKSTMSEVTATTLPETVNGNPSPIATLSRPAPVASTVGLPAKNPLDSSIVPTAPAPPVAFPTQVDADGPASVPGQMVTAHLETGGQTGD